MHISKAYEIKDAKIQFVSLVDAAANKRKFLIKKADDGKVSFTTCGRIIKADPESHHVTGIVYEPMTEDSQGNYMDEAEITKAAYWFAKNSNKVDIQHSFETFKGGAVVENWVAKADFAIDGEQVKKGTWLMTVEIDDPEVWAAIEKGEITGFSMGGIGNYSEEDVDLDDVEKSEKRGILKQLSKLFGLDDAEEKIEKSEVSDFYEQRGKGTLFWQAFDALQNALHKADPITGVPVFESDETTIRACLEDFNNIITAILTGGESVTETLKAGQPVSKAGKKMSGKNKETLAGIYESLGAFLKEFDDPEEEKEAVQSAAPEENPDTEIGSEESKEVSKATSAEDIQSMVTEAVAKAMAPVEKAPEKENSITMEQVQAAINDSVEKAVAKHLEPLLKSKSLPTNLGAENVEKRQEQHYLHGIL